MREVVLEELSSPGCSICRQFEEFWHSIEGKFPNVKYNNMSVVTPEGTALVEKYMIMSSPGIIINGELFSTGGFDREKILAKLKGLSN